MKYLVLLLIIGIAYADNNDLFNQAYQAGKQNNFNMNLNSGSTINSYSLGNHFESSVATNANAGTANSRDMYDHVYGGDGVKQDPNYLYNLGTQEISTCQSKTDPRCTTLNKYGDKDTQTQLQAYSQGVSQKYSIKVMPDPTNSSCSKIIRKVPINATTATCIASSHNQSKCNSIININLNYYDCDSSKGQCGNYSGNPDCTMVRPFIQGTCHYDCDSSYRGPDSRLCPYWTNPRAHDGNWVSGSCTIGETYYASGVPATIICGTNIGAGSPNWHVWFNGCTAPQLATYACKTYNYSDGCASFK